MTSGDIPQIVLRFIERHIDTVPHLETLLLLWEHPAQFWTQAEVSRRIYVDLDTAGRILDQLARQHLIVRNEGEVAEFKYVSESNSEVIAEVAATYRRRVVQIATYIHSHGSSSVREFARAFDLKKER
jgi:DNA-binding MarR family transcriptional regulator